MLRGHVLWALALLARLALAADDVVVTVDGAPATLGALPFPRSHAFVVACASCGFVATFDRDDGVVTGWADVSISLVSLVINGTELAHGLNGEEPRDPDRQHSFYIDAGGGMSRLVCTSVQVVRLEPGFAELAFVDSTSSPLQHAHHVIARSGVAGLYGFDVLTAVASTTISEVRMNTRWNRGLLDHSYSDERGIGQQPTYAYLELMPKVGDETWTCNGSNAPGLPWPESNGGGAARGYVYTKYDWALYHAENEIFGHFGHGRGAFLVPLSGVTGRTSGASYGIGPQHQDLAIHQDALVLNYFSPNHYGTSAYALPRGYTRLYGPWLTLFASGDPSDPAGMIATAKRTARAEIAASLAGLPWLQHALYPTVADRATVTGHLKLAAGDARQLGPCFVILSPHAGGITDVYRLREATYWSLSDAATGRFSLPGIPAGADYSIFAMSSAGAIVGTFVANGLSVQAGTTDLGTLEWAAFGAVMTQLWRIGETDQQGTEFGLGNHTREYDLPSRVPGSLTFTIGSSQASDWYYAQTQPGTWTVAFTLPQTYTGTAHLVVSSSMQQGASPTAALNGVRFAGSLPTGNDSTLSRQAVRGAHAELAVVTVAASTLHAGANTLTLARPGSGSGLGYDFVALLVDAQ